MAHRLRCVLVFAAAFFLSQSLPALQQQISGKDCSHLVVNHSYANQFSGFLNVPLFFGSAPPGVGIVPNAGAGTMTFLPGGKVTNTETISMGGVGLMPDAKVSGTYSLSWDTSTDPPVCSGTVSMSGSFNGTPLQDDFKVVVSPDGQSVEMIHTNPGLIVGATSTPMKLAGCHNGTIAGVFSGNAHGWALLPPDTFPPEQTLAGYVPFAFSGVLQFHPGVAPSSDFPDSPDGSAVVDGWDSGSMNGQTFQRVSTGWYKVNPDCTGTAMLRDDIGHPDFHLQMFVGKNGAVLNLVNVDFMSVQGTPVPTFVLGAAMNRMDEEK